jgi:hypothetical protein
MEFNKNLFSETEHKLYNCIYDGLVNLGLKNYKKIICSLDSQSCIDKNSIIKELKKNLLILKTEKKIYFNRKTEVKYEYDSFINKGAYHKIYKIRDMKTLQYYAMRKQRNYGDDLMFQSFTDFLIHMILSVYQDMVIINKSHYFPKIYKIYLNINKTKIIGIIDLYDGTLKDLICDDKLSPFNKIKIIINCLYQLAHSLKHFQHIFRFMHNDLKVNNIFYKSTNSQINNNLDFDFLISDFGFSRLQVLNPITFKKIILIGSNLKTYSSDKRLQQFISGKDLYFLLHNIWLLTDDVFLKDDILNLGQNIFKDFNTTLSKKENGWQELYNDYKNHPNYEPKNVIKLIENSHYASMLTKTN